MRRWTKRLLVGTFLGILVGLCACASRTGPSREQVPEWYGRQEAPGASAKSYVLPTGRRAAMPPSRVYARPPAPPSSAPPLAVTAAPRSASAPPHRPGAENYDFAGELAVELLGVISGAVPYGPRCHPSLFY